MKFHLTHTKFPLFKIITLLFIPNFLPTLLISINYNLNSLLFYPKLATLFKKEDIKNFLLLLMLLFQLPRLINYLMLNFEL
jgi:hypothetical protein